MVCCRRTEINQHKLLRLIYKKNKGFEKILMFNSNKTLFQGIYSITFSSVAKQIIKRVGPMFQQPKPKIQNWIQKSGHQCGKQEKLVFPSKPPGHVQRKQWAKPVIKEQANLTRKGTAKQRFKTPCQRVKTSAFLNKRIIAHLIPWTWFAKQQKKLRAGELDTERNRSKSMTKALETDRSKSIFKLI